MTKKEVVKILLKKLKCNDDGKVVFNFNEIGDLEDSNNPYYDKLSSLIHSIDASEDFVYDVIWYYLNDVNNNMDMDTDDDLKEIAYEMAETYVSPYTWDLLQWMSKDIGNTSYANKVLLNGEPANFSSLLMQAQYEAVMDVCRHIIEIIKDFSN